MNNRDRRKVKKKARERQRRFVAPGSIQQVSPAEAVEMLVDGAVNAVGRNDPDHAAKAAAALADISVAGQLLMSYLQNAVAHAWRFGWQPADLLRQAARTLPAGGEQMMLDAVAGQMRVYPAARVDRRWDEQVRGAGATVWWDGDEHYLDRWASRHGVERAAAIMCVIRVLALLDTLPEVPVLCPPPGTSQRRETTGPAPDSRILHKVRALLAKAESTEFPEEAEALTAKAQELIARHSIDIAVLTMTAPTGDAPCGRRVGIDAPYEAEKASLLQEVAHANRCHVVWSRQLGFTTIFGFEPDVVAVELLFTSLLVQATTAMTRAGSKQSAAGGSRTRSFRQSFLSAYSMRIGQRLREVTDDTTRSAAESGGGELLPVLASREEAVRHTASSHFPELTYRTVTGGRDREGWLAGTVAADQAIINRARNSVTHSATPISRGRWTASRRRSSGACRTRPRSIPVMGRTRRSARSARRCRSGAREAGS